ncbi:VTT domain-containing protein [Kaarinaea lacus]
MDLASIQPILDWIKEHPGLAGLVVFSIATAESLAVVGILVPGIVFMLGIGALVGLGVLDLWSTLLWAAFGAVIGDGVSYWIGRHFDQQLRSLWPFTKHPELIPRGEQFFHKHGGKSILFGRFIGPIRPIIPAIAGIMHMNPLYFTLVNVVSAIAWAPVVIIPGVAFGSSLHLASEAAGRLVVVLIILLLLSWLLIYLVRKILTPLLFKIFGRWENHWDYVVQNAFNSTVVVVFLLLGGVSILAFYENRNQPQAAISNLSEQSWWQSHWRLMPAYRDDSDASDPFTLQYWGDLNQLRQALLQTGWQKASTFSLTNTVLWLSPSPDIVTLPLWQHSFAGSKEALFLVKKTEKSREQIIVRFWPAHNTKDQSRLPLWLGTVHVMGLQESLPRLFLPKHNDNINQALNLFVDIITKGNNEWLVEERSKAKTNELIDWDSWLLLIKKA